MWPRRRKNKRLAKGVVRLVIKAPLRLSLLMRAAPRWLLLCHDDGRVEVQRRLVNVEGYVAVRHRHRQPAEAPRAIRIDRVRAVLEGFAGQQKITAGEQTVVRVAVGHIQN